MRWSDVRLLYVRELRTALRERSIVVNSLVLPLLMYPLLLWGAFAAITFVQGQEERLASRVVLEGVPGEIVDGLLEDERVEKAELSPGEEGEDAVRAGRVDAVLLGREVESSGVRDVAFHLLYDGSEDRGRRARERLEGAVASWRDGRVEDELAARGVERSEVELFRLERVNVASSEQVGSFLLGLLVPLLMIIMIAVGCFHPAVDATAGEHERSTWETSITTAASRESLVVAKYLYVATLGLAAGLINLFAMTVSMGAVLGPLLAESGEALSFAVPLSSLPLVVVAAGLLALFVAAGMMLFASFARTFKEGQSMVGPFYMLVIVPPLLVQSPDIRLDLETALVPVVNVTLLFRAAIQGVWAWDAVALTVVVELATIVALLWLARRVLAYEDVVSGTYGGSLVRLVRDRLLPKRRKG